MAVKIRHENDIAIVEITGPLKEGNGIETCHDKVKDLISDGITRVVIDLSSVEWMDSRGLGMLMSCFTSLSNVGGSLKLAGATEEVNNLLMITRLITIFDSYASLEEAIRSFS
jgi:anti-sigma B factor antagonist